jgi:neutral ceramidase
MFAQACGGDANPLPRRKIELCEKYGRQLADAVVQVLENHMTVVSGPLAARYEEIDLPLAGVPDRKQLETDATAKERPKQVFSKRLLKALDAGQSPQASYEHYPVQAIQLGNQITIVALGGEVVVDYSLRLKKELGAADTWILGYCNDVMAYIPSRRVLAEGGYEGATSMYVYGLPGRWSPAIEEMIVSAAHRCADRVRAATDPAP